MKRNYNLDLIRIFALLSVISVHYFLNSDFYGLPVSGIRMYAMTMVRNFFMICVPLFMILTGYLMSSKTLSVGYFKGIKKTIIIYVLASIICIFFKKYYLKIEVSSISAIFSILDFSASNYAWYINMYIGLYLLIPFLNVIYNNLNSNRQKQLLIFIFVMLTSLPSIVNIYNFTSKEWWINPSLSNYYQVIIPNYWESLYPLTYYFIGIYLKDNGIKLNNKKCFIILFIVTLISGMFSIYRSGGGIFIWGEWNDHASIFTMIASIMIVQILLNINCINNLPIRLKKVICLMSNLTLGAYLVSYIFDSIIYPYLKQNIGNYPYKFEYFFIIVPIIFIFSMLLSYIIDLIYKLLCFLTEKFINKTKVLM